MLNRYSLALAAALATLPQLAFADETSHCVDVSVPKKAIEAEMERITRAREASQPIREKTGGSTFKNPPGLKAWELIDRAGCRGLSLAGAQVSTLHCNFLINLGDATAADLEALGEEVRRRVIETSGVSLEWEIKRIGDPLRGASLRGA